MAVTKLHGKEVELEGDFVQVGMAIPDFVLVNKDLEDVSLADFKEGRKIISVVPSLDTPVCSVSTRKFSREVVSHHSDTKLLVVSADLPFAMSRFCSTEGLNNVITLSAMRSQDFARDYGLLIASGPLRGITARAIIVLDDENAVMHAELVGDIANEPDYEAVAAALEQT